MLSEKFPNVIDPRVGPMDIVFNAEAGKKCRKSMFMTPAESSSGIKRRRQPRAVGWSQRRRRYGGAGCLSRRAQSRGHRNQKEGRHPQVKIGIFLLISRGEMRYLPLHHWCIYSSNHTFLDSYKSKKQEIQKNEEP